MPLTIPDFCLIALVGTSGSGKSTFAARHFLPTEVVSSDRARGLVDDDETSQDATGDAFDLVHFIARKRLRRRKLVVIDATNVRPEDRASLVALAREHHALAVAIVINPGEEICHTRNQLRPDRQFGPHVVRNQTRSLKRGIRGLEREGFRYVYELRSVDQIEAATVERQRTWTDARHVEGPFDIIGDVHGCADELEALLARLGYQVAWSGDSGERSVAITPPAGRRAFFVGDLVDRGPRSPDVLRIVMSMVEGGSALAVPGNHDVKFVRWANGRHVKLTHGLAQTAEQMAAEPEAFRARARKFLDGLVSHLWLDGGRLAVAHAGIREEMIGRASGAVREFCLYGETTGETDEFGLPVRYNWASDYRGKTTVVYGHTPVPEAEWLNNTICLDTGCCFGGKLTALRWPERELVAVPAARVHAEPVRPLGAVKTGMSAQHRADELLDLGDFLTKLHVRTRLGPTVAVHEAQTAAALEVMSRFAVSPKWLVYLPPTMSPSATSEAEGFLEHPREAFDYYAGEGIGEVVVEEKHMGSRAVAVVCRDEGVTASRFGIQTGETGVIMTRTGRSFFNDTATGNALIARIRGAMDASGFWERHSTGWVVLDCELMPWSAKAMSLIREQYAATGAAARLGLSAAEAALQGAVASGLEATDLLAEMSARRERAERYAEATRRYCWEVRSIEDYRLAPFHLLATEGAAHMDKPHDWHMQELARLAEAGDPVLMATPWRKVDLSSEKDREAASDWWLERTQAGGEGMVVKPLAFAARGTKGLVQPAVKCRGREYLRIIYGPEYDTPGHLARLRSRGLGHKRALAMREFALGHEALHRFVEREPLRRVHECVFAVLALESEPVDPRL